MDILSLAGFTLAFVTLIAGTILKGSGIQALISPAAFVIVFVGTIAAILLQTPLPTFKHAMKIVRWVFKPPRQNTGVLIQRIVEWSHSARKQGLLALEASIETEADSFIRKGLQMLVDGAEPDVIRSTLETELSNREHYDLAGAKVFEGMGIYSPTLGIIGAVMGLMAVLQNLADPSKLGHGIAAAFVATIYGIGLANLFLLPMAAKLKAAISEQARVREMIIEGLIGISQGENPRNIEARLQGYLQ
jgi:chemotaxis protein MotA